MPHLHRSTRAVILAAVLAGGTVASATIVGLNQIVTPDIQPTGVLAVSAQAQHPTIGNSREIQFELGVTPRFELAAFQGFKPGEGLFSAEFNLLPEGPHLLTAGAINLSTRGSAAQPVLEYGYYQEADHFVVGAIRANHQTSLLLGYKRQLNDAWALSTDFQSGAGNAATVGFTYNFTPAFSINPALYRTNSGPHHLLGYVVLTWNFTLWK